MSFLELVFIFFIALGIIPNAKLIEYYKKITEFKNSSKSNRRVIGDDSIEEEWNWVDDEGS